MNNEVLNSEAYKRAERSKAQKVLEYAKSLGRKVRKAAEGECEFSINLKPKEKKVQETGLLRVKEAARYLGMETNTFEQRCKIHTIPHIIINNRNKMFRPEDLDEYIIKHPKRYMNNKW